MTKSQAVDVSVKEGIRLDQFLKWSHAVSTGGQSKILILNHQVKVNGVIENRRTKKLNHHDLVEIKNIGSYRVIVDLGDA